MKCLSLIILLSLLIVSCGPSLEERETISRVACSEIMATRQFEEARRYRILNDALKELGEDPYWSSDMLETNLILGGTSACMNILNPPPPPTAEEIEQERIAEERRKKILEELRVEREKEAKERAEVKRIREEQERIEKERRERKEAEERRIAEQKRLEEERLKAEQARLAEERKLREEEERRRYIKENTITTFLYCPSEPKKSRRSKVPKWFYGYVINKVDNEYLMSEFYSSDQFYRNVETDKSCEYLLSNPIPENAYNLHQSKFNRHLFCEKIGSKTYLNGYAKSIPETLDDDNLLMIGFRKNNLNRTTLNAGPFNDCQIVSEEEFESTVIIPLKEIWESIIAPLKQQQLIKEEAKKLEKKI